jgi:hypothetical protein
MKLMKATIISIACMLALALTATNAQASLINLNFGDQYYVGHINDAIPSSLTDESGYINDLIGLSTGQTATTIGTEIYDRVGSTLSSPNPFPTAVLPGATKTDTADGTNGGNGINVTGFTYILGKYDAEHAGGYVWYVAGLTSVTIPNKSVNPNPPPQGYGLSHYSLFNPTSVPDGGVTLMLLGGALVGLETLRRRFRT